MDDIAQEFRLYLISGERIVWTGRPALGVRFSGRDVFLVPFSILWAGFAFFWEGSVLTIGALSPMALFGVPFILAGLYLTVGRFLVDAWARSRTIYALSDQRALILRRVLGDRLIAVTLSKAPQLRLNVRGRTGDIEFEQLVSMFGSRGWGVWNPALDGGARFIGVENPTEIYQMAQRGAGGV